MLVGPPGNFPVCPCVKTALPINTDSEFESRSERGIQHYVINFVSDLRQVGGFLRKFCNGPVNFEITRFNCIINYKYLLLENAYIA
jgi:hypothetical protein